MLGRNRGRRDIGVRQRRLTDFSLQAFAWFCIYLLQEVHNSGDYLEMAVDPPLGGFFSTLLPHFVVERRRNG